jgi:hypothetical protein
MGFLVDCGSALACIIREAVEEWFWGGEITAKMLAAA